MAKLNFVKNGVVMRLPPGFRFHPTDEELVVQYLKRKVFSLLLPANFIPEIDDVCKFDPCDLPGNLEEERYFFSRNEANYVNGKRSKRGTDSGYWKATGKDKQILSSMNNQVVGIKKTFVFFRPKSPNGNRTDWIMHEYRLHSNQTWKKNSEQNSSVSMKNWVLCRIFLKKNKKKDEFNSICYGRKEISWRKGSEVDLNIPVASPLSSSCSSGVTEICCEEEEEESSSK